MAMWRFRLERTGRKNALAVEHLQLQVFGDGLLCKLKVTHLDPLLIVPCANINPVCLAPLRSLT